MPYLKPPAFQRLVFNKLAMRFGIGGAVTLITTGRKSGQPVSIPVVLATVDGRDYLVSARGEAQWVKNIRAKPEGEIIRKGKRERFTAVDIPAEQREPIIAAYRVAAGRAVNGYWAKLPSPADHPTFRMDRV